MEAPVPVVARLYPRCREIVSRGKKKDKSFR